MQKTKSKNNEGGEEDPGKRKTEQDIFEPNVRVLGHKKWHQGKCTGFPLQQKIVSSLSSKNAISDPSFMLLVVTGYAVVVVMLLSCLDWLVMAVRIVEQCESSVSMSISEEMQRTTITMQMQRTTITMQMKIEAMQKEIDAMQMRMRNGGEMN
ncbi:hypothetical protein RHGRI_021808 [Rhododendron griersonianum]|uniref:Uncharacterized protein n=1 Tax=Rhododendron griersonianum TaxID=479676 RepID=A0AAV6JMX0_9ERIC|nr:hypothetical protein RHGRI_021808 [Rhododendron griersonianum]